METAPKQKEGADVGRCRKGSRKGTVFVVSSIGDGRWRVHAKHAEPKVFLSQMQAEDCAIALALKSVPSVVRVQYRTGRVVREIRYRSRSGNVVRPH